MEGKLTKRRRIYSVEPNKIAQAEFTRIYLSHLVPALMKLNQNQKTKKKNSTIHRSEEEEDDDDEKKNKNKICVNVVKHEVGMAMVWSAPPGFAWSKALKANEGIINDHHHNNAPSSPYNVSASPTNAAAGSPSKSRVHDKEEDEQDDKEEDEDEEGLKRLRRLIPGGEEMGDDEEEMARELESYISCLQMQVNILQRLAHTTP